MAHRILVVDDESSVLITLVANLELEGFEVVEAEDGARALEVVKDRDLDLVLSDVRMPGMDGVTLFKKIREVDPELPVVLMTGFALESAVAEAVDSGVFTVLPKPFQIDHLIAVLTIAAKRTLVLVIDDDAPVAESAAEALCAAGVPARAVFDADEALTLATAGEVDICVVDMVMPGMSGPELMERLQASDPSIVCVAISGHDVPAMFKQAAEHAYRLMRKPVPPLELVRTIADARGRPRGS